MPRICWKAAPIFDATVGVSHVYRWEVDVQRHDIQLAPAGEAGDVLVLLQPRDIAGRLNKSLGVKAAARSAIGIVFRQKDGPELAEHSEAIGKATNNVAELMAIKAAHGGGSWQDWPDELRLRDPKALASARQRLSYAIDRIRFSQFLFFRQWDWLHRHATGRGVQIIGDVPIFVASDSADVWSNPDLFLLDEPARVRTLSQEFNLALVTVPTSMPVTTGRVTASVISVCPPHRVMFHCRQAA